jgi:hypothetical protein
MATEREHKSTRFSRWRERRRAKAVRASEIRRELKAERARHGPDRQLPGGGGDRPGAGSDIGM